MPVDTPQDQPEKFNLRSHDTAEDKRQELLRLFPEVRTEGGKLDFERLKAVLGETIDVGRERYGMNWPGKADCMKTIQAPSMGTLLPCPEESVNWDATENLIIEGDNLEALKLLQKSYLGKVKMIYIDPPYNTGNDFIYPDNYSESLQTYLEYTGQTDGEGRKFGTNSDSDGRFHSKWLNMMYPRLYFAKNLLREDGLIFVSIDDHEVYNLRQLMNDIFGEENFLAETVWNLKTGAQAGHFVRSHEYVLVYAKTRSELPNFGAIDTGNISHGALKKISKDNPASEITFPAGISFAGQDGEFSGELGGSEKQFILSEKMVFRNGLLVQPVVIKAGWGMKNQILSWIRGEETFDSKGQRLIRFFFNAQGILCYEKERGTYNPKTVFTDIATTKQGSDELSGLFGTAVLDFPKPSSLIKHLIHFVTVDTSDGIILDFFAGSGTTAQSVLEQNAVDGGNRKFILVQLPEQTDNPRFPTIAEITRERVRRVIKKLEGESVGKLDLDDTKQDLGFRAYRLAESNFQPWNAEVSHDEQTLGAQLSMHIDHIREGRSANDLLYEILLKSGFSLTTPVQTIEIDGKTVYSVAEGLLIVCLERELSLELIRGVAERKPERVVCLDAGFDGNDQLKTNAVQTFRTKGVTSFKTI